MAVEGRDPDGKFAKGGPGNPNATGRPRSVRRIEGILQRIGQEEILCEGGELKTRLELLMRTVYKLAEDGTQWAVQFVAERTEGKISERQEVAEENREPVKLLDIEAPVEVETGSDG